MVDRRDTPDQPQEADLGMWTPDNNTKVLGLIINRLYRLLYSRTSGTWERILLSSVVTFRLRRWRPPSSSDARTEPLRAIIADPFPRIDMAIPRHKFSVL